jgi:hypothetical protein
MRGVVLGALVPGDGEPKGSRRDGRGVHDQWQALGRGADEALGGGQDEVCRGDDEQRGQEASEL